MSTSTPDAEREAAPPNNLPSWAECELRVHNSKFFAKQKAEGGHGPEHDAKLATQLHRFIHEYDDDDPYRSAWFLHRLELLIDEAKSAALSASPVVQPREIVTLPFTPAERAAYCVAALESIPDAALFGGWNAQDFAVSLKAAPVPAVVPQAEQAPSASTMLSMLERLRRFTPPNASGIWDECYSELETALWAWHDAALSAAPAEQAEAREPKPLVAAMLAALRGLDEAYCRSGNHLTKAERHEDRLRLIAARAAIAAAAPKPGEAG